MSTSATAEPITTRAISVERVVWFSDAVVGIVQTFLVVLIVGALADLQLATDAGGASPDTIVFEWIGQQFWRILAHTVAFFFLVYLWRRHHEIFRHLVNLNRGTIWLNSAFLVVVCLVPFATALVARSEFSPISMAWLFLTVACALALQYALFSHATRENIVSHPLGSGTTALRIFIGLPAVALTIAAAIAYTGYLTGVTAFGYAAAIWLCVLMLVPVLMNRYLTNNVAHQPPASLEIPQSREDLVHTKGRSPLVRFFSGANPDRTLLFTDGVYAICLTLLGVQLLPEGTSFMTDSEVVETISELFSPDLILGNFWLFLVIFILIQVMWLQHARMFVLTGAIGSRTMWINSLHVFTIIWLPLGLGIIGASPYWAVVPWWIASGMIFASALTLALLNWSVLIYHKQRTVRANLTLRVAFTEIVYICTVVCIIFFPLGIFFLAFPLLLLKYFFVNLVWRIPGEPRRTVGELLKGNPNHGLGTKLSIPALTAIAILIGIAIVGVYLRNGFWLLHPS